MNEKQNFRTILSLWAKNFNIETKQTLSENELIKKKSTKCKMFFNNFSMLTEKYMFVEKQLKKAC